ncbi:hypothetical protein, partial [Caulobacter sp. B11]|uniref:hypothetical protein n=1 Tax=Caulobacter sp. B11 TaxID=2048899 RepID=UPI001F18EFEE
PGTGVHVGEEFDEARDHRSCLAHALPGSSATSRQFAFAACKSQPNARQQRALGLRFARRDKPVADLSYNSVIYPQAVACDSTPSGGETT